MRLLKDILIIVFISFSSLILGSCIFWGLTDNKGVSVLGEFNPNTKIFAEGDYLYVSNHGSNYSQEENDLLIFNLSNPVYPEIVGKYQSVSGVINNVIANDIIIYIRTGSAIEVLDFSDRANPIFRDSLLISSSNSYTLCEDNGYLYCVDGADNLQIINVQDPSNILKPIGGSAGSIFIESIRNIAIDDNIAYVSCQSCLVIVDISDKSTPTEISRLDIEAINYDWIDLDMNIIFYKDTVFIGYEIGLLYIIDVSNLMAPILKDRLERRGSDDIALWDDLLYTGASFFVNLNGSGVGVYEMTNPLSPKIIHRYAHISNHITQIELTQKYIYAFDKENIMVVLR